MNLPLVVVAAVLIVLGAFLTVHGLQTASPPTPTTTTIVVGRTECITISGAALPPGVYCRTPLNQVPSR